MEVQNEISIYCLPDEIIALILHYNSPKDILNFGATCKHYNDVVKSNNSLWKYICATTFPPILCKYIGDYKNGNWLYEMKSYSTLKEKLYSEIIAVSPSHYWKISECSLDNVHHFFTIITKTNFFYAIHILQNIIKTGNKLMDKYECIKPYTLTEMYYSKAVIRHFIHTFLAVKWAKAKLEEDLPPQFVINFFLQWIDPSNLYLDEDVNKKINILVEQVNKMLETKKSNSQECSGLQIIQAVTHVIYKQRRVAVTTTTDVDTLNISKVIDNKCGNLIVMAAIYQAVATRCGACCELIVFPNHLFLEWTDETPTGHQLYNIDLRTGDVCPKRQCPFAVSRNRQTKKYSYCPESLIQYIYSSFIITMGALRNWNTQNAMDLLDFLRIESEHTVNTASKRYLPHLMDHDYTLKQCEKPDLKQPTDEHIQLITSLATLNTIEDVPTKKKIPKKRSGNVKFAVGMICYHKIYHYVCIIRAWDDTGCPEHFPLDNLHFGRNQPFYYIIAVDQSERYVAQENLMELTRPTRLYHLEYQISRDFTHFDGFAYVLNDQKRLEYPEDQSIIEVYRIMCQQKPNNI